jgi:hypothetical protein
MRRRKINSRDRNAAISRANVGARARPKLLRCGAKDDPLRYKILIQLMLLAQDRHVRMAKHRQADLAKYGRTALFGLDQGQNIFCAAKRSDWRCSSGSFRVPEREWRAESISSCRRPHSPVYLSRLFAQRRKPLEILFLRSYPIGCVRPN